MNELLKNMKTSKIPPIEYSSNAVISGIDRSFSGLSGKLITNKMKLDLIRNSLTGTVLTNHDANLAETAEYFSQMSVSQGFDYIYDMVDEQTNILDGILDALAIMDNQTEGQN